MLNKLCLGWTCMVALVAGASFPLFAQDAGQAKPSAAESSAENLTDQTMSAAMRRHVVDDSENELYTRFRYSPVKGLGYEPGVNRRDPSSIIKVGNLYYVWYTRCTDTKYKWLNADIWYATSPDGVNWTERGPAVRRGPKGSWDDFSVFTTNILVADGKYYLYYQGSPQKGGRDGTIVRAQGVAIAEHPLGPFKKSPLNPVINSGHETCMFPWKSGVAAIVSLDGAEKNTVQFAPDGINFEVKSLIQIPPVAPGPFVPDAFADNGNGRGITWGLCHIMDKESGNNNSILARFDCDLSLDVDRQYFKRNNLRFNDETYFQKSTVLPDWLKKQITQSRSDDM